jgi:WD40 repeat protein
VREMPTSYDNPGPGIAVMAVSPQGDWVATMETHSVSFMRIGFAVVRSLDTFLPVLEIQGSVLVHSGFATAFSQDDRYFVFSNIVESVTLYDLRNPLNHQTLLKAETGLNTPKWGTFAFNNGAASTLAVGSLGGSVEFFSTETARKTDSIPISSRVVDLGFSADNHTLYVAGSNGSLSDFAR